MKKNKLYAFVILGIFVVAGFGCKNDFLNTKFDTLRIPEVLNTDRNNLWSFGNQCYINIQYGFTALDNNLFATASDEAQQVASTSNAQSFNNGAITPYTNPLSGLYKTYYDGIRSVNFFLDFAKNGSALLRLNRDTLITDSLNYRLDKQMLKYYIAEAHVCRAYYYAELIKMYGGVPLINTTFDQGTQQYFSNSSYDEVVNYIVTEIDNNKASLQVNWKTDTRYATSDGRFSLGSALAVKTRVLLYAASPLHNPTNDKNKWIKAAAAAAELIATPKLNYALNASYATFFTGANPLTSAETILAVRRPVNNTIETQNYPIATPGGNTGICPSNNLVSDYEYIGAPNASNPYLNRDPRLAATVVYNGSTWNSRVINEAPGGSDDMTVPLASKTGYYLKKFLTDNLNLVQGGTAQNQWVAFRYAEILLDYAEAMNEAYGPDALPSPSTGYTLTARQALAQVRARASASLPSVTTVDPAAFRTALKHERRIELAFEDHRYWDLLRWKDAEVVLNQPIQGMQVTMNGGIAAYQPLNVANRIFHAPANYYFPFAYSDVAISNGTLIQNPGY